MKLAVMDGPLYAHSNGLVFVSRPTKVHVLLLDQVRPCCSCCQQHQISGLLVCGVCEVGLLSRVGYSQHAAVLSIILLSSSAARCSALHTLQTVSAYTLTLIAPSYCFELCCAPPPCRSRQFGCRTLQAASQATPTLAPALSYAATSPAVACCLRCI